MISFNEKTAIIVDNKNIYDELQFLGPKFSLFYAKSIEQIKKLISEKKIDILVYDLMKKFEQGTHLLEFLKNENLPIKIIYASFFLPVNN